MKKLKGKTMSFADKKAVEYHLGTKTVKSSKKPAKKKK